MAGRATALMWGALSHVGWWLDWHTRGRRAAACQDLGDCDIAPEQPTG